MFAGIPPPPSDLKVTVLNMTDTELIVNLIWSLDHHCVIIYLVEVTNRDTNDIMIFNISSDSILISLTLVTDIIYSMRVRGADRAGRGEWSTLLSFPKGKNTNPNNNIIIVVRLCALAILFVCPLVVSSAPTPSATPTTTMQGYSIIRTLTIFMYYLVCVWNP